MNALESPSVVGSETRNPSPRTIFRPARATHANRTLTLENAEKGIVIRVGEQFSLHLGVQVWNLRVRDETLLAADGQGNFHALKTGKTRMYATSEPPQNDSGPPGAKLFLEIPVTVID